MTQNALEPIEAMSLASSALVNGNFEYLDNKINTVNASLITKADASTVNSQLTTMSDSVSALNTTVNTITNKLNGLIEEGIPIITLSNTLNDNEIWLEGAEVSKTTYSKLYAKYGNTYGTASSDDKFVLPDFRNRALWGANNFGYISAGLPALYNMCTGIQWIATAGGVVSGGYAGTVATYGTIAQGLYGASSTVQPPAIKIRVKTRFE